jgi:hypothetical protein
MKTHTLEKDWTAHGFRCVVLMNHTTGNRCGYVGIPKGHLLHGVDYSCHSIKALPFWLRARRGKIGKRGFIPILCNCSRQSWTEVPTLDVVFDVHGSITYSGDDRNGYPVNGDGLWWFGYDCGHCDDAPELNAISSISARGVYERYPRHGIVRSLEYCVDECERLAEQLKVLRCFMDLLTGRTIA